jgi:hypothetical protein
LEEEEFEEVVDRTLVADPGQLSGWDYRERERQ